MNACCKQETGSNHLKSIRIPFDKSKELAVRYQVARLLAPIFDFNGQQGGEGATEPLLTKEQHVAEERKRQQLASPAVSALPDTAGTRSPSARRQSRDSASTTTRINVDSKKSSQDKVQKTPLPVAPISVERGQSADPQDKSGERHRNVLMAIFLNEDPSHIPELLLSDDAPQDFNTELVIDDQGHTALHWASALARVKVVELLIERGANVVRTNYAGETALMRACMVVNNYEQKSFERILFLLQKSVLIVDKNDRTFLHHIALSSAIEGREDAAAYYLQCTLKLLLERKSLQGLIDIQDANGDTALNIAARAESKLLVDQFIDAGASSQVSNNIGIKPEDYEEEDTVRNIVLVCN